MTCSIASPTDAPRRRVLAVATLLLGALLITAGIGRADVEQPVHIVEIAGEIDLGLAPYLARAIDAADADDAAALVVRIDTPGGRLDAALQMRASLLGAPLPTVAYVDREAFSAGALIAIAAESIYFAPGGVMGAATPVDGGTGAPADEKVVSAVRSTFRATAVERGRDPDIAAAMVDADVEVEGVSEAGKLVTLTVDDALELGFAEGVASDLDTLLVELGLDERPRVVSEPSLAEGLVRFITNPILASLLITVGIYLVIGDLLSGGVGAASGIGVSLLGVFFWGHLLAGLTGWEDIALVAVGILLLLIELLVVPGFGVFGVLGLGAVLGGSFLAMINRDLDFVAPEQMLRAATTVAVSFLAITVAVVVTIMRLSRGSGPPGLVLRTQLGSGTPLPERRASGWLRWFGQGGGVLESDRVGEAVPANATTSASTAPPEPSPAPAGPPDGPQTSAASAASTSASTSASAPPSPAPAPAPPPHGDDLPRRSLIGATGVALSDLRPAGIAEIDGERIDVVTEGGYLDVGTRVVVTRDEGYRRVVRRHREDKPDPHGDAEPAP